MYSFQGCFHHGHERCHEASEINPIHGKTMGELFKLTVQRTDQLKKKGYKVIEKWECEWTEEKKKKSEVKNTVQAYHIAEPLCVREALFGGRTNAVKLFCEEIPGKTVIRYFDIKSLYPFVQSRCKYPEGHPKRYITKKEIGPLNTIHERIKGLIKCTVKPPRQLYIPVLPMRTPDHKLVFTLCKQCAVDEQQEPCEHDDFERNINGTWTHPELQKAVEKGYEIVSVDEAWHWEENKWTTELFSDYINTFYTVKEESSGWPSWVETEGDKDKHCRQVKKLDGVQLDPGNVEKNPGLRQVAKLALNSLWGE